MSDIIITRTKTYPLSLNDAEREYQYGYITREELDIYLEAWNATPGRFTMAYIADGMIRQKDKP